MRVYIDHVLALLPFEPDVHARLGGPPCSYVGHPLTEHIDRIRNIDPAPLAARLGLSPHRPVLAVLPGSRRSEIERLMQPFGEAMELLIREERLPQVVIPAIASLRSEIEHYLRRWPLVPHIIEGEDDKWRAFKLARAALAASGTVTLELALAGTPMLVAYRVDALAAMVMRRLITATTIVLPNHVLGENVFPELIQEKCTPAIIAGKLAEVMSDGPHRAAQIAALEKVPGMLAPPAAAPSDAAAQIVLRYAARSNGA